jgi:subtilisin family serine protease
VFPEYVLAQMTFERTYGGNSADLAYSVQQTTDGGYIVAGWTQSFGADYYDIYLVKTEANGDKLWTRRYGYPTGSELDVCYCIRQTSDGGYILFGVRQKDVNLMKIDVNGDSLWAHAYDFDESDRAFYGQQTSDGGYIVTGGAGPTGPYNMFLLKTDAGGDSLWARVYNFARYGRSVQQTFDGGYIVGGTKYDAGLHSYLMKTDANGDTLWTCNPYGDIIYAVIQTADSGYVFAGGRFSGSNGFAGKTDANGNILWTQHYSISGWWYTSLYSMQQTQDGGYIMAGSVRSWTPYKNVILIKTNANGDTLWTRIFGGPTGEWKDDEGWSVQQTSDGGYILAGISETYGAGGGDFYLIKTDSLGNLPDIETKPTSLVFDYTSKGYKGLHCPSKIRTSASMIEPILAEKLSQAANKEVIPIIIVMSEQLDDAFLNNHTAKLNKKERRQWVISELKALAQRTQQDLVSYLKTEKAKGKADRIHSLWIVNSILAKVPKDVIIKLASISGINQILLDEQCFHILGLGRPTYEGNPRRTTGWGVQKIRADSVWTELGYTGDGIIIGHIDTGVNYNHTDIINHMWAGGTAYPHHGFDYWNVDNDPIDDNGHGTHTAGTIAGDGTSGTQTGVAPDARIMALKAFDAGGNGSTGDIALSVQFALDHGADLISMSAGTDNPSNAIKDYYRNLCNSAFAADMPMAFAAGNGDGAGGHYPVPHDINTPGDVPAPWYGSAGHSASMAVGATDSLDVIASFSSYGPTEWDSVPYADYPYPPGLMKPDVSGPGVDVISLWYGNNTGYAMGSGTSMACPHLTGTIALMLEKNPLLTCVEIDSIIENFGVIDLGTPGRDNYYGAGRIDAYNAVVAVPVTTAKKGDFYIHNASVSLALKVSDITWSASWIKDVSPGKPEIWKQDSTPIRVYVDSAGMAPGTYSDVLWIYSNDPDENPYPEPVTLILEDYLAGNPYITEAEKSGNNVKITWQTLSGADHYVIYRNTDPSFVPSHADSIGVTSDTFYTNVGVVNSSLSFYYLVKGVSAGGAKSAKSNMAYKFNKFFNENPGATSDKNWTSLPWHSEYAGASDLTSDLSPAGDPLTGLTNLRDDQLYESWLYNPIFGWTGTDFSIVSG